MEIRSYQEFLAKLYTDAELRKKFFCDRKGLVAAMSLSSEDAALLEAIPQQQVESFARSLIHKRLGEVKGLLPYMYKLKKHAFDELFFHYASSSAVEGIHKHQQDAVQFAEYLLHHCADGFERELLRFEMNRVKRYLSRKKFIKETYTCSPTELVKCMQQQRELYARAKRRIYIYYRTGPLKRFRLMPKISLAISWLLHE